MTDDPFDTSDEATGLPPLADEGDTMLVLKGAGGDSGIVMLPPVGSVINEPIPVRYLRVRGLTNIGDKGQVDWVQVAFAIPESVIPELVTMLTKPS